MQGGKNRIVLAGGGTGGHLYPALSVAHELRLRRRDAEITFVGARSGIEVRLVPAAGYPLWTLSIAGLKGTSLGRRIRSVGAAAWAVSRCLVWMMRNRPDLVIGVGGFASGPAVLAATWLGVKTMVLEQNVFPGATNRWLAPRVDAVCLPSEAARQHLRGRVHVTGNPVREEFLRLAPPPGRDRLALLVFGGSRGARSINRGMIDALGSLAACEKPPRIVHQTGAADEKEVRSAYEAGYPRDLAEVHPFLDDMARRLGDADMVVCRAGASTIAELCAAGRPSILVPYPFAADEHQRHNAESLERAGAALLLADRDLDGERLAASILALASDPSRRVAMGRAARALAHPDATRRIADIAERLLEGGLAEEARDVS